MHNTHCRTTALEKNDALERAGVLGKLPPWDPPPVPSEDQPHRELEELTATFRLDLAAKHRRTAGEARDLYRMIREVGIPEATTTLPAPDPFREHLPVRRDLPSEEAGLTLYLERDTSLDLTAEARAALTRKDWHSSRARGQRHRFRNVRACGARNMIVHCAVCAKDKNPTPERCGVGRVCLKCSLFNAQRRRARFGRGRARVIITDAHRFGLHLRNREHGAYSEKMLTLTVPHLDVADAFGDVAEKAAGSTVRARIAALYEAWKRFAPNLRRFFTKTMKEPHTQQHRAFEWTEGDDENGHPHFHIWLWCPFIPWQKIKHWWAKALIQAGWPVAKREWTAREQAAAKKSGHPITPAQLEAGTWNVVIDIKKFESFDGAAAAELIKGGTREALKLSRGPATWGPKHAQHYAEGWTIAALENVPVEVQARLYEGLEGRRLAQASRGFFLEAIPTECQTCHPDTRWMRKVLVRFEAPQESPPDRERGPPE